MIHKITIVPIIGTNESSDNHGDRPVRRKIRHDGTIVTVISTTQKSTETRTERPFVVDAIVVLPDHLHAIMTLPPDDSDFSDRWRRIKGIFTRSVVAAGIPISRDHRGEY